MGDKFPKIHFSFVKFSPRKPTLSAACSRLVTRVQTLTPNRIRPTLKGHKDFLSPAQRWISTWKVERENIELGIWIVLRIQGPSMGQFHRTVWVRTAITSANLSICQSIVFLQKYTSKSNLAWDNEVRLFRKDRLHSVLCSLWIPSKSFSAFFHRHLHRCAELLTRFGCGIALKYRTAEIPQKEFGMQGNCSQRTIKETYVPGLVVENVTRIVKWQIFPCSAQEFSNSTAANEWQTVVTRWLRSTGTCLDLNTKSEQKTRRCTEVSPNWRHLPQFERMAGYPPPADENALIRCTKSDTFKPIDIVAFSFIHRGKGRYMPLASGDKATS